jgi:uncharacterized protein YeaO (DUF488 family)
MEHGDLMQSATARWTSEADGTAGASTRSFARLHDAVTFVMELDPEIRGTARIETAARSLKIGRTKRFTRRSGKSADLPHLRAEHRASAGAQATCSLGADEPMSGRIAAGNVRLKRAYERPSTDDGTRILIDRLWPRGVPTKAAALDLWMKDIAPSSKLRSWFGHDPARWQEFRRRYADEVRRNAEPFSRLRALVREGRITLVYGARDEAHNHAVVLRDLLLGRAARES